MRFMLELAGSSVVDWVQDLATKAPSCLSCLISGAFYVSIYFSRFFSSFQSFSQFTRAVCFAWSESCLYCGWYAYGLSMTILVFLSLLNWHKRPYGCWTKSWTKFFIFKIQMEAALSWMPEWKNGRGTWSNEGFNIQPAMTPRRH